MGTIYTATILSKTVAIRTGPGLNYSSLENISLSKGDTCFLTEIERDGERFWGHMDKGWICLLRGNTRYVDYQIYTKPKRMVMRSSQTVSATYNNEVSSRDVASTDTGTTDTTTTTAAQPATEDTFKNAFNTIVSGVYTSDELLKKNMRLFGLPYQFRKEVDTRVDSISKKIGRKYIENIVIEAPVVTIIPGKPSYLPGTPNKEGTTHALIQAATGNFAELQQLISNDTSALRYYDFEQSYTEYMKYVNILCRTAATFLELTETLDGEDLQSYDWRNYRWTGSDYRSIAGKAFRSASSSIVNGFVNAIKDFGAAADTAFSKVFGTGDATDSNMFKYTTTESTEEEDALVDSILQTSNFLQFYCDPEMGGNDTASNSTSDSKIKGMFDSGSDLLKELAFVTNSGGINGTDMENFVGSSLNALSDQLTNGGSISSFMQRILDVGGNVIKGENVIMPEIYNSSSFEKSYNLTVHLKAPYGNRFSYYMDVLVPLFHLLALAIPKQTSGNTYGAPFLVKAFCEGKFSCNLGIVSNISINKDVSPESYTNDGFPSEIDVTLTIVDLYSDLTMTPQSSPIMFINNSSMIEYLATTCGLNLIQPQIGMRLKYTIQAIKNAFGDIPQNVISEITDSIENLISSWISIA